MTIKYYFFGVGEGSGIGIDPLLCRITKTQVVTFAIALITLNIILKKLFKIALGWTI